jgi:hypothetical protein
MKLLLELRAPPLRLGTPLLNTTQLDGCILSRKDDFAGKSLRHHQQVQGLAA